MSLGLRASRKTANIVQFLAAQQRASDVYLSSKLVLDIVWAYKTANLILGQYPQFLFAMYNPNQPPPLNQAQLARARAQMPRAGWWLNNPGQQYHPDYHPQQYQRQRAEDDAWQQQFNAAQQQPPGVLPQYEPPDGPPPGYIFAHGPMQPQPLVRAPRQPQAVQGESRAQLLSMLRLLTIISSRHPH